MITIDAQGKKLGRVASEAAKALLGKGSVSSARHTVHDEKVEITNASKMLMTARKRAGMTYTRYSGYPGGLKTETLDEVIRKHGHGEALRRAVKGMLPGNKLRDKRLKNLSIHE